MIRPVNSASRPFLRWKTSAACNAGQVLKVGSSLALPIAAGDGATAIILGVCVEDVASGGLAYIYPANQEFEFDIYQGSTIDTGALEYQGVAYDVYVDGAAGDLSAEGEMYLNINDTGDGFILLSQYDNVRRVATGNFIKASRYLGA
ncbi:MAG: hypothetical protein WCY09_10240 [Candidatus Omnitrophota bacterium]|jgi:hypothetical protein